MNNKKMVGFVVFPFLKKTKKEDYIRVFQSGAMKLEFKFRLDGSNKPWFHCETWSKTIIDAIEKGSYIELTDYEPRRDVWQSKSTLEWGEKMYIQVNEIRVIDRVAGANMADFPITEKKEFFHIGVKEEEEEVNSIDWLDDLTDE